jgi:hypothetical protein
MKNSIEKLMKLNNSNYKWTCFWGVWQITNLKQRVGNLY